MDCWHQGLEEVNLEGWNDPLESLFFFFLRGSWTAPQESWPKNHHVPWSHAGPRAELLPAQDILWFGDPVNSKVIAVCTDRSSAAHGWGQQDRGVCILPQIPTFPSPGLPTTAHRSRWETGRQSRSSFLLNSCPKDVPPAHSWGSDSSQSIFELDLDGMTWLSHECGCCLFCVFPCSFWSHLD